MTASAPGGDRVATASFGGVAQTRRAVRALLEKSVPADSIQVLLLDGEGRTVRVVSVEDEEGALRGALIGAAVGAGIGVLVVAVAGLMAIRSGTPSGIFSFGGVFAAIAGTAGACIPLGALWGMGSWRGPPELSSLEGVTDRFVVRVESEKLAGLARQVFGDQPSP